MSSPAKKDAKKPKIDGYIIGVQLDDGHTMTGNVWKCIQESITAPRAIKVLKPSLVKAANAAGGGVWKTFLHEFRSETKYLVELAHPNIVGIIDGDVTESEDPDDPSPGKVIVPYYVLEFVRDTKNLREYARMVQRMELLVRVVEQILEGAVAIHAKNIVHMDLKPDNILISMEDPERPVAKITDLGFARKCQLQGEDSEEVLYVTAKGTKGYFSPTLENNFVHKIDWPNPNMVGGLVERSLLTPRLDLYGLGKTIQEIAEEALQEDKCPQEAFKEQCSHLLDFGKALEQYAFESSAEALANFRRNFTAQPPFQEARHLPSKMIRIPEFVNVPFSGRIKKILNDPWFQRLRGVKQLGFVHLVYPGAVHTRFEHSLGVFNKATKYLLALWENSEQFRKQATNTDLEATMLAALTHDLGQYPFAHITEETGVLPPGSKKHEELSRQIIRGDTTLRKSLSAKALVEINAARFFPGDDQDQPPTISQRLQEYWSPETIALAEKLVHPTFEERAKFTDVQHVLAGVLSGPIDCDKLDYLSRDGHHASCPFPRAIDEGRLLISLQMLKREPINPKEPWVLGVTHKGRATAELLVFVRYIMFTEVYWHHAVRIAIRMFQEILSRVMEKKIPEERLEVYTRLLFMSDDEVLRWLRSEASELTKMGDKAPEEIVDALGRRDLYKRVLTISGFGSAADLHPKLLDTQKRGKRKEVEEFLAGLLNVEGHHLLVDIPSPRPGDDIHGIHMLDADTGKVINIMQQDSVLSRFKDDFLTNAKKIRILISPREHEEAKKRTDTEQKREAIIGELRTFLDRLQQG